MNGKGKTYSERFAMSYSHHCQKPSSMYYMMQLIHVVCQCLMQEVNILQDVHVATILSTFAF